PVPGRAPPAWSSDRLQRVATNFAAELTHLIHGSIGLSCPPLIAAPVSGASHARPRTNQPKYSPRCIGHASFGAHVHSRLISAVASSLAKRWSNALLNSSRRALGIDTAS